MILVLFKLLDQVLNLLIINCASYQISICLPDTRDFCLIGIDDAIGSKLPLPCMRVKKQLDNTSVDFFLYFRIPPIDFICIGLLKITKLTERTADDAITWLGNNNAACLLYYRIRKIRINGIVKNHQSVSVVFIFYFFTFKKIRPFLLLMRSKVLAD